MRVDPLVPSAGWVGGASRTGPDQAGPTYLAERSCWLPAIDLLDDGRWETDACSVVYIIAYRTSGEALYAYYINTFMLTSPVMIIY